MGAKVQGGSVMGCNELGMMDHGFADPGGIVKGLIEPGDKLFIGGIEYGVGDCVTGGISCSSSDISYTHWLD